MSGSHKIQRDEIFKYVKKKYGIAEDYPFPNAPSIPVMRHPDNRKLFAIIMNVRRKTLGLDGTGWVDIINVKLGDPYYVDMVVRQQGYLRGYHIRGGNWVSILLDGTAPFSEICKMVDESFIVTASRNKKRKYRPPKEWIVPANPKYYDIEHAFDMENEIDWKQGAGIRTGDTVFIYVAAPVSAILYKCKVTETDIPYDYADKNLTIKALMKIKLIKRYNPGTFAVEVLKNKYGIFAIRGPRSVPHSLSESLKQ